MTRFSVKIDQSFFKSEIEIETRNNARIEAPMGIRRGRVSLRSETVIERRLVKFVGFSEAVRVAKGFKSAKRSATEGEWSMEIWWPV